MALQISVLGPLIIQIDGQAVGQLPQKGSALLAYLATLRGGVAPRERLADLLWPEQTAQQGRHSLRNCLLELRQAMGSAAQRHLVADTVSCRLVGPVVDLDSFQRLAASQARAELRTATELYRGEFLADLAIKSQPFQEWLSVERPRLLAQVSEVLERLVQAETASGAHEQAIRFARRLVGLDPLSEPAQRTLMQAYFRAGRRPEALRQYYGFVDLLKGELAVAPDAETKALANAIARSAGALEPDEPSGWPVSAASPRPAAAPGPTSLVRWPCVATNVNVAIEPLLNLTGDQALRCVADGFAEDLLTDLVRHCRGMSLTRLTDFRDRKREFDYVLTGSLQRGRAQLLRINLQVVADGRCRWARRFECSPDQLLAVQTEVTERISRELRLSLLAHISCDTIARSAGELAELPNALTQAAAALDGPLTPESAAMAQQWYLAALARDPWNVDGLVGLAHTCQQIASGPGWTDAGVHAIATEIGGEAVSAALALAPGNAYARAVKGMLGSAAGQVEAAARDFEEALEADPGQAVAQSFAGYNLAFLGRAEGTGAAIRQAMHLDHSERRESICYFFAGFSELLLGRAEDAIRLLGHSLERNPQYGSAQLFLAAALDARGRRTDAKRAVAQFRGRYPGYRLDAFDRQWLRRAKATAYRAQIQPLFERVRALDIAA